MSRCPDGQLVAEFERLASIETDECVVWPYGKNPAGYGCFKRDRLNRSAHVEALLRRTPRPFPGACALHGPCNNPSCVNYRHLRWGTYAENTRDRLRDGTLGRRLTSTHVHDIREKYGAGVSRATLANRHGVTLQTIHEIVNRQTWRWLEDEVAS